MSHTFRLVGMSASLVAMMLGALMMLDACATAPGDTSRLIPTGRTVSVRQAQLFCLDHPTDPVCLP